MKRYDLGTIVFIFILLGPELLGLVIMTIMLIYEKFFPKEEVENDRFYDIKS